MENREQMEGDQQAPAPSYYVSLEDLRKGKEFSPIPRSEIGDYDLGKTARESGSQAPKTLGLHFTAKGEVKPSHFIGAVWLEKPGQSCPDGVSLVVRPKIENIDAVTMFTEVAANGYFQDMDELLAFKPEEPLIEGEPIEDLSLLQVAYYLKELALFCQRQLRIDFVPFTENLQGRVKGRVLVMENLRRNIVHARPDRMLCRFETMTMDTPANRILKWALALSMKFLAQCGAGKSLQTLWDSAHSSSAALSQVTEVKVSTSDFLGIHYGGFMQRYKGIHRLAKMIIRRLRVDAEGRIEEGGKTVPFWIDMNKLFEDYVGVLLQRAGRHDFKAQKSKSFGGKSSGLELKVRPDYITDEGDIVVDAKYKSILEKDGQAPEIKPGESANLTENRFGFKAEPSNADIYQIIAYSTLFAGTAPLSRRAFLAMPVEEKGEDGDLIKTWKNALDGQNEVPSFRISLPSGLSLLVGILPTPLPVKKKILRA